MLSRDSRAVTHSHEPLLLPHVCGTVSSRDNSRCPTELRVDRAFPAAQDRGESLLCRLEGLGVVFDRDAGRTHPDQQQPRGIRAAHSRECGEVGVQVRGHQNPAHQPRALRSLRGKRRDQETHGGALPCDGGRCRCSGERRSDEITIESGLPEVPARKGRSCAEGRRRGEIRRLDAGGESHSRTHEGAPPGR
jgi:hypothetical protein